MTEAQKELIVKQALTDLTMLFMERGIPITDLDDKERELYIEIYARGMAAGVQKTKEIIDNTF